MDAYQSLALTAALVLTVLSIGGHAQGRTVAQFFDEFANEWVGRLPAVATLTRYFTGPDQDALDRQLAPETRVFHEGTAALARRGLEELARFDRARMASAERISADVMHWQLAIAAANERFLDYDYPFQQFSGVNVSLLNLLTVGHPVRSERDARNYVARMEEMDARVREALARAVDQAGRGILPPRFILIATIAQMRQFASVPPRANVLVTTLGQKIAAVPTINASVKDTLESSAALIVEREIYPAWREAITWLESQLPRATDDAGLWRFKDGADAYADRLRQHTTTTRTAQEIHDLGLGEVARIEREMDAILRELGRATGPVGDRIAALKRESSYPETDEGRARLMADIDGMIRDAERRAATLFDVRPKAPVIAQPFPEFRWATAAASYSPPPLDGSRPGIYQMPLRSEYMTRFGLRTLVYHETVPGHHFQIALSVEDARLPKFRQVRALGGMAAVSEGWALYAERLAVEEGWYEGDLEGRLGQLDDELFRAKRLVVDTGLHAMRWTRQQAIDYGMDPSEVDRYVVMPGQACAYKIGQLEILRLREKARAALGAKFQLRQFHNVVLGAGIVPLAVLERIVDDYIANRS